MRKCALVAASDFNARDFVERWRNAEFAAVIAADAGYAHLQDVGCAPDIVLGDFDSLGYVPAGDKVEVHPTHKDESDLELAFGLVARRGFDGAVVYGALGGRFDHSIANLQMCAGFAESGMQVELVGAREIVNIVVGPSTLEFPVLASGTVSVFSAVDVAYGVTEQGLEYSLDNVDLRNRTTWGLSNEFVGRPASVSVERGTLYVIRNLVE